MSNKSGNGDLYESLIGTSKDQIRKAASSSNPAPTPEYIEGLKRADEYSLSKHFANVKIWAVYAGGALFVGFLIFIAIMMGWVIYSFFCELIPHPEKVSDFLGRAKDLFFVVFSTLFLNYVITKKS